MGWGLPHLLVVHPGRRSLGAACQVAAPQAWVSTPCLGVTISFAAVPLSIIEDSGRTHIVPAPSPERAYDLTRKGTLGSSRDGNAVGRAKRIQWTEMFKEDLRGLYQRCVPQERGYMKRLERLWVESHPGHPATGAALAQQCRRMGLRTSQLPTASANNPTCSDETPMGTVTEVEGVTTEPQVVSENRSRDRLSNTVDTVSDANGYNEEEEPFKVELRKEFLSVLGDIDRAEEGCLEGRGKPRCKGSYVANELIRGVDDLIVEELKQGPQTLWRLNCLVYAGAVVIERRVKKPRPEQRQLTNRKALQINHLRRVIGWLECEIRQRKRGSPLTSRQKHTARLLRTIFGDLSSMRKLRATLETQKSKLRVRAMQVRRLKEQSKRKRLNEAYRQRGPQCLQHQRHGAEDQTNRPSAEEVSEYWQSVIGEPGDYNPEDPAILAWQRSIDVAPEADRSEEEEDQYWQSIWQKTLKKARSWKAPGHDGLCAFWWKIFHQAAEVLGQLVRRNVSEGGADIPDWLVRGRTVLIPKEGCEGRPDQYRPITCLNTAYKLLTGTLTTMLQDHSSKYGVMPDEQKALRPGKRGCLDALMVDTMVGQEAYLRGGRVSVAWIDYKKAFDRVPHGWLRLVLRAIKAPDPVRQCLSNLIQKWKSQFSIGRGDNAVKVELTYRRGLFQGDSLSPLLFCLCLAPLSTALRETVGYSCASMGMPITHQLFMDDLKVYARGKVELGETLDVVDRVSKAIGMELGLRKCAVAHMSQRQIEAENYLLSEGRVIGSLTRENVYRYLGIEQMFKPSLAPVKERIKRTYVQRLRRIWSSSLNARFKVQATNIWAVSVLRYFSHLKWTRTELGSLDRKTRAVLRQCGCHQYGASVERLYLPRGTGGRGIHSLLSVRERELVSMATYLTGSDDPLLQAVVKHQLFLTSRGKYSVLEEARQILEQLPGLEMTSTGVRHDGEPIRPRKAAAMLKAAQYDALQEKLERKTIHGVFYKQCQKEGWDTPGSHLWLRSGKIQGKTEGLIIAAQDGVIHTRSYLVRVLKRDDCAESCRVCGRAPETLGHILSACPAYYWSLYKTRHDRILYQLVLMLSQNYGIPLPESMKWKLGAGWIGTGVLEKGGVKLSVDLCVPTDRELTERRPDLIAYLSEDRRIVIFEIACAWDSLVVEREGEKARKYAEFAADLATQHPGWQVKTAVLVVGALGSMGSLRKQLAGTNLFTEQQVRRVARECQLEALCSAVRLLRRHLVLN